MKKLPVLLIISLLCTIYGCSSKEGVSVGKNGKPLNCTIGITHTGASYTMNSKIDFLQEGARQVEELGSKVIKLWFADTTVMKWCYPYNIKWSSLGISNSVDMAKSEYFNRVFNMDFCTYILETTTFDSNEADYCVVWEDGMSPEECSRTENETYNLAKYFMTAFNGTGKEFIIQNWEGDNMLGGIEWRYNSEKRLFYKREKGWNSANETDDMELRTKITGLTDWFNYRQKGIDKAREEMAGKTDVTVRHALEVSFTYLDAEDDGWPFSDTPLLIDHVVKNTDCDLYSYSSWMTHTVKRAQQLKDRLRIVEEKVGDTYIDIYDGNREKPRRPFARKGQVSRLMLGEYGSIEGMQYADTLKWGIGFTDATDRRHREVLQIQTDIAEAMGLEFIVFWELYCNVYRGDLLTETINMVNGDQIKQNEHLQGNWLIRVDGTCTEGYKYLHGLCDPVSALYADEEFKCGKTYRIDGPYAGFELSGTLTSDYVPENLNDRHDYDGYVKAYVSVDGTEFNPITADCFFTDWKIRTGKAEIDIKYVDGEKSNPDWRFIRFETDGEHGVDISRIKLYKPNPTIEKQ